MGIGYGYNVKKTMTYVMGWYPEVSTWLVQWKNPQLDQWFSQQTSAYNHCGVLETTTPTVPTFNGLV